MNQSGTPRRTSPTRRSPRTPAAWVRSLAEAHGRNPVAAEQTVLESKSFSDTEALEQHLIDLRAKDLPDLFNQLQGRTVTLGSGAQVQLQTLGAPVVYLPMSSLEKFLLVLSDPNLAYLLLIIGMAGLLVEIYHLGLILPGVAGSYQHAVGALCPGDAGRLLGRHHADHPGVRFLHRRSLHFHSRGTGGRGLISLVIGSLLLFSNQPYGPRVSDWLIAATALVFALLLALLITLVVRGQRQAVRTGREGLLGQRAIARTELHPDGTVFVSGELWNAVSESGTIPERAEVVITGVEGLRLRAAELSNNDPGHNNN